MTPPHTAVCRRPIGYLRPRIGLALIFGLAASASPANAQGDDARVLRDAADKTLAAPYLIVSAPAGRRLLFSRQLTVFKRRGLVTSWLPKNKNQLVWYVPKRCYRDIGTHMHRDLRLEPTLVPRSLHDLRVKRREGALLYTGRLGGSPRSADVDVELRLDNAGRIGAVRQRGAEYQGLAAGPWVNSTYDYPTRRRFTQAAGRSPGPRCPR